MNDFEAKKNEKKITHTHNKYRNLNGSREDGTDVKFSYEAKPLNNNRDKSDLVMAILRRGTLQSRRHIESATK